MHAQAVASLAGANLIDLSPRNTAGRYPGKNVAMMVHMAFKVGSGLAGKALGAAQGGGLWVRKAPRESGSRAAALPVPLVAYVH